MRGTALFRAFLPLAVYAVLTELAIHGLSGLISAASRIWSWVSAAELSAALPWANAAAGLAAVSLLWGQYSEKNGGDGSAKRSRHGKRGCVSRFSLLIILGICCCLGGSGLIFLLGEILTGTSSAGAGSAAGTPIPELQTVSASMFSLLSRFLCSGLFIPFTEEFLFRRGMYESLREEKYLGCRGALIISSILFGLYHGRLLQGIYAGLLGALLAFLYEREKNFAVPVIVHGAANSSAVLLEAVHYGQWLENSPAVLLTQTGAAVILAVLIFKRLYWTHTD
ncbi:MAG: CPBP family intramembrane metalloprotease [Clostridium sp.]|nr:CPBP family intramembrane metalloprotease [Clostridium sp.]